jgi:hypothetical protein
MELSDWTDANVLGMIDAVDSARARRDLVELRWVMPLLFVCGWRSGIDGLADIGGGAESWGRMMETSSIDAAKETEPWARAMARDQIWLAVLDILVY